MMITGWKRRYSEILKEFGYDGKKDAESAQILRSMVIKSDAKKRVASLIHGKTVLVIGSGPSLSMAIPHIPHKKTIIAADSAVKPLVDSGIIPDIVVTDLDGDENTLKKIGRTKSIIIVHAHGDNMHRLHLTSKFKNCIGTTQSEPHGKIENFGGFTDGDRAVFVANHFQAKKIILLGMDFGRRIGKFSNTKRTDRRTKVMKLKKGEALLEWLSTFTKAELLTTSREIKGFKKISYKQLGTIIN